MSKLHFKFKPGVNQASCDKLVSRLSEDGADVRPLFKATTNKELASVYALECESAAKTDRLKNMLESLAEIEYVETEVRRKLIRPKASPADRPPR